MCKIKKLFLLLLFFILFIALIGYPALCLSYATDGLERWFHNMIPTLLPFMILSSLLIKLNLHTYFIRIFSLLLKPIFRMSDHCIYGMVIGFLCGFPLGAKTCVLLYEDNHISKEEASFLLAFCNQIGPIYFCTLALPLFSITNKIPYIFGMYGIPLLYGFCLRYTFYKQKICFSSVTRQRNAPRTSTNFFNCLDESIHNSLEQITMLGGYMILFQLGNILPFLLHISDQTILLLTNLSCEITNGLFAVSNEPNLWSKMLPITFTYITFGGFCCIAQTFSVLHKTPLSKKSYIVHKAILSIITFGYYSFVITGLSH